MPSTPPPATGFPPRVPRAPLRVEIEGIALAWPEMRQHFAAHLLAAGLPPDPNSPLLGGWLDAEERGAFALFTARRAGTLVGYALALAEADQMDRGAPRVRLVALYSADGPWTLIRLLRAAEREARSRGVGRLAWSWRMAPGASNLRAVAKRLGYNLTEMVVERQL